jgi:hypothetical protein
MSACVRDRNAESRLDQVPIHILFDKLIVPYQGWQEVWNAWCKHKYITPEDLYTQCRKFVFASDICLDVLEVFLSQLSDILRFDPSITVLYIVPSTKASDEAHAFVLDGNESESFEFISTMTRKQGLPLSRMKSRMIEYICYDPSSVAILIPTVSFVSEPWISTYFAKRTADYRTALYALIDPHIPVSDLVHLVNAYLI